MSNVMQNIANTATGATVAGGGFSASYAWITSHAPVIGLTLTAISLCVALLFYVLNYRLNRKRLLIAIENNSNTGLSEEDRIELKKMLDRRVKRRKLDP